MPLLIDGHNLIGHLADLLLSDPDDEVRLVERLRRYHARTGKRIEVFFDRGFPGGGSPFLSTHGVAVRFAPGSTTADALILQRVQAHHNPVELTVVSSDQAVIDKALKRGARVIRSSEFALQLAEAVDASTESAPDKPSPSDEDAALWRRVWGDASDPR